MKHVVECTKAIRLLDSMAFTLGVHIYAKRRYGAIIIGWLQDLGLQDGDVQRTRNCIETTQQKLFEQQQIPIHILQEVTVQDAKMWMQFC